MTPMEDLITLRGCLPYDEVLAPSTLAYSPRRGTIARMEPIAYDLIVIGSGPAGESGAAAASLFGKRVAMIENSPQVGGASTNTGTLPSKTLRETALAISGLRARDLYGVDLSLRREATVADFMFHERRVTANERKRVERNLARYGVMLYRGMASFVDPHTIHVAPQVTSEADSHRRGVSAMRMTPKRRRRSC